MMSLQAVSWVRPIIPNMQEEDVVPVPLSILAQLKMQRASPLLKTRFSVLELVEFYDVRNLAICHQSL